MQSQSELYDMDPHSSIPIQNYGSVVKAICGNTARMGYQQMFYQHGSQLVVQQITKSQKNHAFQEFLTSKDIHEKGIKKFKSAFCGQQSQVGVKRRRAQSTDTEKNGAYYMNNWISHQEYYCEKPPHEHKSACLIYQLLGLEWNQALKIIGSFPKTPQMATLEFLVDGFKKLSILMNSQENPIAQYFINREVFNVKIKGLQVMPFVNLLQDSRNSFQEAEISMKKAMMKQNINFLAKFASNYRPQTSDSYLKLAFKYLGNTIDQQEQPFIDSEQDYLQLLLRLDLRLPDRLNMAIKLLGEKRRRDFCRQLQQRLCLFGRLQNIIYYSSMSLTRERQDKIEQICRSYIDYWCDLETVAYLSYQFPFLKKYYLEFRYSLQSVCEQKQLQKLQNHRWSGGINQSYKWSSFSMESLRSETQSRSFFDYVFPSQQRIEEWKVLPEPTHKICQICCKKIASNDSYIECDKCKHGGHLSHMLRWFQKYQCCPHVGCPCLCN